MAIDPKKLGAFAGSKGVGGPAPTDLDFASDENEEAPEGLPEEEETEGEEGEEGPELEAEEGEPDYDEMLRMLQEGGEAEGDGTPEEEVPGEVEGEPGEMQEGGEGRFGELIPLLESNAGEVAILAEDVPPEAVDEFEFQLSPQEQAAIRSGIAELDGELAQQLADVLGGGISEEEATELAEHVAGEGMSEDPRRLAAWLYQAAQVL